VSITLIIIILTSVISFVAFNRPQLMYSLTMNPYSIHRNNEYYRFITSGLIHRDHIHLFFNMLALYFFGEVIEEIFEVLFEDLGSIYFILLYVMGIVVSDIPTFFKQKNSIYYNSLGASGGVSSVIFSYILFVPVEKICIYFFICLPGFILGTLYVIYSYYQGKKANDNINHSAHLYGALFGLVFCIILYPKSIPNFIYQIMNWTPNFF
jgi:membrane associated rhomboid family serine protease